MSENVKIEQFNEDMIRLFVSNLYQTHFENPKTLGRMAFQHIVPKDYTEDNTDYIKYANTVGEVMDLVKEYDGKNCFITVNEQVGGKGKDFTLLINAFYVDIDDHRINPDGSIHEFLSEKIADGTLPRPDIRVKTGRGEGHYFLLGRPIYVTENTEGLLKVREYTYQKIFDYYKTVLKEFDAVYNFIDTSVRGFDRYCRLPGTFNMVSGNMAELIWCEKGKYADINAIRDAFHIKSNTNKKKARKPRTYFHQDKIIDLMETRKAKSMYYRSIALDNMCEEWMQTKGHSPWGELYLFWKYNTIRAYTKIEEAQEEIININQSVFNGHYSSTAIKKIFKASETVDIYKIKTENLLDIFGLSFDEAREFGFGDVEKRVDRQLAELEKQEKREFLVELIKEHRKKYKKKDLLLVVNEELSGAGLKPISLRTLGTRLKELGLEYKKNTLSIEETAAFKREEARKEHILEKKTLFFTQKEKEINEKKSEKSKKEQKTDTIYLSPNNNGSSLVTSVSSRKLTPDELYYAREYDFQCLLQMRQDGSGLDYYRTYVLLGGNDFDFLYEDSPTILSNSKSLGFISEEEEKVIFRYIHSLFNENRLRAYSLLRKFNDVIKVVNGVETITYADFDSVIYKVYKKHLPFKVEYKPATAQQREHLKLLDECKHTWSWFSRGQGKSALEKKVVSVYKTYHSLCKQKISSKQGSDLVAGLDISYKTLKSTVLFRLNVLDIKSLAKDCNNIDSFSILERMVALIRERYPEKFITTLSSAQGLA